MTIVTIPSSSETNPLPPPAELSASARIDIASIRREQIIDAAIHIIAHQGLPNLSLSEIETHTGMKRGQLTYYFRRKEDILLAVFDRMIQQMKEQIEKGGPCLPNPSMFSTVWERLCWLLPHVLAHESNSREFQALQHTFLAEASHRTDYRERLSTLYDFLRQRMIDDMNQESITPPHPPQITASPRTVASFVQAIIHGLKMQLTVDPQAFDREEMVRLCLQVLAPLFASAPRTDRSSAAAQASIPTNHAYLAKGNLHE